MCALFGSFDSKKLTELARLNSERGFFAHSLAFLEPYSGKIVWQEKSAGAFPDGEILIPEGCYAVAHIQAPTSEQAASSKTIHPAEYLGQYPWHNGLLKPSELKRMQAELSTNEAWDTKLILQSLASGHDLSRIDGSFSCFWLAEKNFHIFRNELSPLFYDEKLNFSSVPFNGASSLSSNILFKVDWKSSSLFKEEVFSTKQNPYFLET